RTSLKEAFDRAANQDQYLDDIRKRFRVETLGTSLIRVSYAAHDPATPSELVKTALVVRAERLEQSRQASSAALTLLYQRQLDFAQQQALDAQKAFDGFNQSHTAPLATLLVLIGTLLGVRGPRRAPAAAEPATSDAAVTPAADRSRRVEAISSTGR